MHQKLFLITTSRGNYRLFPASNRKWSGVELLALRFFRNSQKYGYENAISCGIVKAQKSLESMRPISDLDIIILSAVLIIHRTQTACMCFHTRLPSDRGWQCNWKASVLFSFLQRIKDVFTERRTYVNFKISNSHFQNVGWKCY